LFEENIHDINNPPQIEFPHTHSLSTLLRLHDMLSTPCATDTADALPKILELMSDWIPATRML
jgi:methylglyoxal synthase